MLYIMLYTVLCNIIHNVLHNMLRAKNPSSHFPLLSLAHNRDTGRHRQLALVFRLILSWSEKECPCSTTVPAALTCLAFICARLRTCCVVCQWCHALWLETARPPCPIDLATAMELLPIPARGGATEVGCTSSSSGYGCMGGASHGISLVEAGQRLNERRMLDDGQRRR
jgi:hypothetical protein